MPRLESDQHPDATGSYGPEAREWLGKVHGMQLRGWQGYALDRALEHDDAGQLVWRTILLTVARQSGKSTLARGLVLWRLHQGAALFDEPQLVLSLSRTVETAWEVMLPATAWVMEKHGQRAVRFGNARPGIVLPTGDRWVPIAARPGAGVGYSAAMLFVDEAWAIPIRIVSEDLAPTMAERASAQLYLVSTAGDSDSELMASYRQRAIERLGTGDPGRMLLLEWSAPPEADPEELDTWRWASPEWTEHREEFLRDQFGQISRDQFATQYLNQWVHRIDGWLTDRAWQDTLDPDRPMPTDRPWLMAVESAFDGSGHAIATACEDDDGRIVTRLHMVRTIAEVDTHVRALRQGGQPVELYVTPTYVDRIREHVTGIVSSSNIVPATQAILDAFERNVIAHDGAPILQDHLYRAKLLRLQGQWKLVAGKIGDSVHGARAVMFAVWMATKVSKPAPVIHTRTSRRA